MSTGAAIQVQGVGKSFYLYTRPKDRLKEFFTRRFGRFYGREFKALQDITFSLQKGDSVGIIGRNGSGKSTLLQIIAGTLQPTVGTVAVHGRLAALLELGSGFKPEFSGRDNIYMNAALLGLSKRDTDERFEDIAAFADIGEFIDQPVKTYSSGMLVRVAFAVQVAVEPDILIIDEALSVGDIFFQQKCMKRMRELQENGTTLLFVSHDMSSVRDLCNIVVYLKQSKMVYYGEAIQATHLYFRENNKKSNIHVENKSSNSGQVSTKIKDALASEACWTRNVEIHDNESRLATIIGLAVLDEDQHPITSVRMTGVIIFRIFFRTHVSGKFNIIVSLQNRFGALVTAVGSCSQDAPPPDLDAHSDHIFELRTKAMFEAGEYTFSAGIGPHGGSPNMPSSNGDRTPWVGPFSIIWPYDKEWAPFLGLFGPPVEIKYVANVEELLSC